MCTIKLHALVVLSIHFWRLPSLSYQECISTCRVLKLCTHLWRNPSVFFFGWQQQSKFIDMLVNHKRVSLPGYPNCSLNSPTYACKLMFCMNYCTNASRVGKVRWHVSIWICLCSLPFFSNRRRGRGFSNRIADWLIDLLDLNADDLLQSLRPMSSVESVVRSNCVTTDDFVTITFDLLVWITSPFGGAFLCSSQYW